MAKKIGEVLIERGLLSRPRLEQALQMQLMFGGNLGTCLLELGYVNELSLALVLSSIHGMKCARPEAFEDIPKAILGSLPTEEVRRRRVVPFGATERALHVAAVHPSTLPGVAALARRRVVPYVAPEMSVVTAMEKYYGIPRRLRYLSVPYATIVPRGSRNPSVVTDSDDASSGTSTVEEPPAESPSNATPSMPRLGDLPRRMSCVNNHGELGEVLLDFTAERTARSILFAVEAEQAVVVNWRGEPLDPSRAASFRMPLTPGSLFGLVGDEPYFRGPLPVGFDCRGFHGALGIPTPGAALVLPLYGESRLEAVLYGDGERIGGADDTWLVLLDQVGLALRMLDYKRQLCPAG